VSRDIDIFASRASIIPQEEILSALRARGISVQWRTDPFVAAFSRRTRKRPWRASQLVLEGDEGSESTIDITNQPFDGESLSSLKETYSVEINQKALKALEDARVRYQVSAGWTSNRSRERLLINAADALSELGDGVILDNTTNRFYERAAFRSQHLAYFQKNTGRRRSHK